MTNYEDLKTYISVWIRKNGTQAITGNIMQSVLLQMVDVLGGNYALAGVATPSTIPPTPDGRTAYVASTSGTFEHFIDDDGIAVVVPASAVSALLMYEPATGAWHAVAFGMLADGSITVDKIAPSDIDTIPTAGSNHLVTSGGTHALIAANAAAIAELRELYESIAQSDIVVVESADWPIANPEENTIYRVTGVADYYDYMWNGTSFILMATYNNAIDDEPTRRSDNLVKSGGVFDKVAFTDGRTVSQVYGAFDPIVIGQAPELMENPPSNYKYVDVTGLHPGDRITTNVAFRSTSIYKQVIFCLGGVVTSYIDNDGSTHTYDLTCDGTYDRVIFQNATVNVLTVDVLQSTWVKDEVGALKTAVNNIAFSTGEKVGDVGIDAAPTADSPNIPTSGGTFAAIQSVIGKRVVLGYINASNKVYSSGSAGQNSHTVIADVIEGRKYAIYLYSNVTTSKYYVFSSTADGKTPVTSRVLLSSGLNIVTVPAGALYLCACFDYNGNGTEKDIIVTEYLPFIENMQSEINNLQAGNKQLKILLIGSSHGVNTISMFPVLAYHAGIDVVCGNLYIGSATIGFYKTRPAVQIPYMAEHDVPFGSFALFTNGAWGSATPRTVAHALDLYAWDVIILQRGASENTAWDAAMSNFFQDVLDYIRDNAQNTPRIYFNSGIANATLNNKPNQITQTNNIMSSANVMRSEFGIDIIPTAVAVQYARATCLDACGVYGDMASDTQHLDTGVGQFVTGCAVFEKVCKDMFNMSIRELDYLPIYSDVSGNVVNSGAQFFTPITDYYAEIGKTVAALAVQDGEYKAGTASALSAKYGALPTTYGITNVLTNCTTDNPDASIASNEPYMAVLTADTGFEITDVTVTMGGIDVTSDVYVPGWSQSGIVHVYHTIRIGVVTGHIVITATASTE